MASATGMGVLKLQCLSIQSTIIRKYTTMLFSHQATEIREDRTDNNPNRLFHVCTRSLNGTCFAWWLGVCLVAASINPCYPIPNYLRKLPACGSVSRFAS